MNPWLVGAGAAIAALIIALAAYGSGWTQDVAIGASVVSGGVFLFFLLLAKLIPYRPYRLPQGLRSTKGQPGRNPFKLTDTSHGSATWAWSAELRAAGMMGHDPSATGFFLGSYPHGDDLDVVNYAGEGHRIVVGATRSGKFTSVIVPTLLHAWKASAIVFDVKNGEAANVTGSYRAANGNAAALDPFGITDVEPCAINPLDLLDRDDPHLSEKAKRLTDAIYIDMHATDGIWDQQARNLLTATLLHVVTAPQPVEPDKTLGRVRDIIRKGYAPEDRAKMAANPFCDGIIADRIAALEASEKAKAKMHFHAINGLETNTEFLDAASVRRTLGKTTFDIAALRRDPSTLYVSLPAEHLQTMSRWLRLVYATLMDTLREADGDVPVHAIVDEFPAMGKFPRVATDMATMGHLGVKFTIIVQSLSQLADPDLYGTGWNRIFGAADVKQLVGAGDLFTAEQFSTLLGQTTIRTESQTVSHGANQAQGGGNSRSTGHAFAGRPLMTPDEIIGLRRDVSLVHVRGMKPMRLMKLHYPAVSGYREAVGLPEVSDDEADAIAARINGM